MKEEDVLTHPQFEIWIQDIKTNIVSVNEFKHVLSHRIIFARFWQINCTNKLPNIKGEEIELEDFEKVAVITEADWMKVGLNIFKGIVSEDVKTFHDIGQIYTIFNS